MKIHSIRQVCSEIEQTEATLDGAISTATSIFMQTLASTALRIQTKLHLHFGIRKNVRKLVRLSNQKTRLLIGNPPRISMKRRIGAGRFIKWRVHGSEPWQVASFYAEYVNHAPAARSSAKKLAACGSRGSVSRIARVSRIWFLALGRAFLLLPGIRKETSRAVT